MADGPRERVVVSVRRPRVAAGQRGRTAAELHERARHYDRSDSTRSSILVVRAGDHAIYLQLGP